MLQILSGNRVGCWPDSRLAPQNSDQAQSSTSLVHAADALLLWLYAGTTGLLLTRPPLMHDTTAAIAPVAAASSDPLAGKACWHQARSCRIAVDQVAVEAGAP